MLYKQNNFILLLKLLVLFYKLLAIIMTFPITLLCNTKMDFMSIHQLLRHQ